VRIELLFWAECPSYPEAKELLEQVLEERGIEVPIEMHEVRTHEEADELAFPGSPTIRIDGRDVDPVGAESPPALTCRVYRERDGRTSPIPSRQQLEEALAMSVVETAPTFDLPGVDGRNHSLGEYADAPVLVLVQSCNHCPYVLAWEARIDALQRRYADRGVRIVAINSNDATAYPADSFENMIAHARQAGYSFDYLYDESQEIARVLGSQRTPEAFVFDPDRRLVYHGAVDDNREEDLVTQRYLRDAIEAALAGGTPLITDTPPVGCTVKWRS
jgi:peroxiredoxin